MEYGLTHKIWYTLPKLESIYRQACERLFVVVYQAESKDADLT